MKKVEKKEYSKPQLKKYGNVSELTQRGLIWRDHFNDRHKSYGSGGCQWK